jgi:hypothetical protein
MGAKFAQEAREHCEAKLAQRFQNEGLLVARGITSVGPNGDCLIECAASLHDRERLVQMPDKDDEMILALGRFVTAVDEVEYVMFETILVVAEEDANEVHRVFYKETFGPKVEMLVTRLEHSAFDEHRAGLDHLIGMLRKPTKQHHPWRPITLPVQPSSKFSVWALHGST